MSEIRIPAAALEAGARAITMALILAVEDDCRALALTDDERMELSRAAFLAMIEAWDGMYTHEWQRPWLGGMSGTDLVLPLPQEITLNAQDINALDVKSIREGISDDE